MCPVWLDLVYGGLRDVCCRGFWESDLSRKGLGYSGTRRKAVFPGSAEARGLEIADGDAALVTFAMMAQGKMDTGEMERKRAALLEYCKMDTLAMVRLHEVLHGFEPGRSE